MTPEAAAALHAAAFPGERGWSAAEFRALLAQPGTLLTGGDGAMLLGRVAADEAEILTLATDPAARRQGRARAALAAFEAAAGARGARAVFLEVAADNAPALALYEAAGYTTLGRRRGYYSRDQGGRVDAVTLRKPLVGKADERGSRREI